MPFHSVNESRYFIEVALRIDLVIGEYRGKVLPAQAKRHSRAVAGIEVFHGFVILKNFLDGNAEDGRWFWFKG